MSDQEGSFGKLYADELHVKRVVVTGDHPFVIELPWGAILFHANEVTFVSSVDDPPGVRFCSKSGGLGKLSWNIGVNIAEVTRAVLANLQAQARSEEGGAAVLAALSGGGGIRAESILDLRQTEVVLLQGKQDEQHPGKPGGEFTLHLADPLFTGSDADKAMKRVILLNSRSPEITGGTGAAPAPAPGPAPQPGGAHTSLGPNESLAPRGTVTSPDGSTVLAHQSDGNVVLYVNGAATWSTGTAGKPQRELVMQGDGNLVLYAADGSASWSSGTDGHPGARLDVVAGKARIVDAGGTKLWEQ